MTTTLTMSELRTFLNSKAAIDDLILWNETYQIVDIDWFFGKFADDLRSNALSEGLEYYKPGSNVCKDFTRRAWNLACDCNAENFGDSGITVGMWAYTPDNAERNHAIVVAVGRKDGELVLAFMEPQTQLRVELSATELLNVQTCLI